MAIDIIEGTRLLDKDLSKTQVDFLLAARSGVPFSDADRRTVDALTDRGLIEVVPFSHPRALNSIMGIVVSEDGAKVLNVVDNRHWAKADTPIESPPAETKDTDMVAEAQEVPKGEEAVGEDEIAERAVDDRPFEEDAKTITKRKN